MKTESDYAVYFTDTDGSERKGCTVRAKSTGHAIAIARQSYGLKKITEAVDLSTVKTSSQLMKELKGA